MAAVAESQSLRELINPHDKQIEFLEAIDRCRFVLYGGARGGGKSYILRWALVRFLLKLTAEGVRGVTVGLFCVSFPELRLRQIEPIKKEFPSWLGYWHATERKFVFHPAFGGHVIQCCNIDDPDKYKGAEFAAIAVDELTLCVDRSILDVFMGCMRAAGVKRTVFMAATNPDGPGHSWVKRLWISLNFSHPDDAKLPRHEFAFVRALPTDNPHLSEEYIEQNLEGLPESKRKPWLEGSWDLFEGQRFVFNPLVHVVEPFEFRVPVRYFRTIDYGFQHPYACTWWAVTAGTQRPDVYLIREDYKSGLTVRDQARRILDLTDEPIAAPSYLDNQCWEEDEDGLSIAHKFIQYGVSVQQVHKDRATGWVAVEDLLHWEHAPGDLATITSPPRLQIFSNCVMAQRQITDALWDPKKPGDIMHGANSDGHWDILDTIRYFALTHLRKPKEQQVQTWVQHHKKVEAAMKRRR
jgi:phage terminase large subunit